MRRTWLAWWILLAQGLCLVALAEAAKADPIGPSQPGPAANQSSLGGCIYNSSAPTLTNGQQVAAQCDANGNTKTAITGSITATVTQTGATTTNASGTVATGGTFQSVLASSGTRKGCLIQNPTTATEPLYVFFGANGSATTASSISLSAGSTVSCSAGGNVVLTDNVSVTATTSTHAFVAMSQ